MSAKPGVIHKPEASTVCFASREICGEMRTTLPPRMPTSERTGGDARPSNKRPFLITRSSMRAGPRRFVEVSEDLFKEAYFALAFDPPRKNHARAKPAIKPA